LPRSLEPGQYTSIAYTERLEEIGAAPSIGTIGDCLFTGYTGSRTQQQTPEWVAVLAA